jgi:hypothetical protein
MSYVLAKSTSENLSTVIENCGKYLFVKDGNVPSFDFADISRYVTDTGDVDYNAIFGDIMGSIVQLNKDLRTKVDDMKNGVDLYKGLVRDVQKSLKELKDEVSNMNQTENTSLQERITILENNLRSLRASITDPIFEVSDD